MNDVIFNEDYKNAFARYLQPAEQGDATAQFGLGLMCYNGEGVRQNGWLSAAKLRQRAAKMKNTEYGEYLMTLC